MSRKKKSGSNNNNDGGGSGARRNAGRGGGGGGGGGSNARTISSRGRRGGRGGGGHRDGRRETTDRRQGEVRNTPPTPLLSIPEIRQSQQEVTISNFSSSELSYKGSDRIVFITNGDPIKTIWKKILRRQASLNQDDARIFVSSALVATDYRTGYEVEELVTELGNPESGLKKLREIINFPAMSCDAGLNNGVLSFQYVVLPFLGLLTRTAITECILEKYVHAIIMVVYINLDSFLYNNVMKMLETLVQRNSVADNQVSVETLLSRERYLFIPSSLGIFFLIIVRLLTELLRRIKEASINETMHQIAHDIQRLKSTYQQSLAQSSTSTDPLINNLETRRYFFMILEGEIKTMNKMLNNGRNSLVFEQNPKAKELNLKLTKLHYKELARKADAERSYDPPGELSKGGKRHDNDFTEISEISVIPTKEEILCDRPPFLPFSLPDAPHFLPDGATKLFDTQFRLLREDMLNPIRGGLIALLSALSHDYSSSNNNKISKELKKIQNEGGKWSYNNNGTNDNGDLQVYTNVKFVDVTCDRRKGFACTIGFTPPKIRAKSTKDRKEYWERSKRLLTGSLVTLLLPNPNPGLTQSNDSASSASVTNPDLYLLYFGVVMLRDEKALATNEHHAMINVSFMDPSIYPIALNEISKNKTRKNPSLNKGFLVESTGVYLEAYYHILKTLQTATPSFIPFEKYLAPNFDDLNNEDKKGKGKDVTSSDDVVDIKVENPMYTRAPGFQFDLSVLCKYERSLKLHVANTYTHDEVAEDITKHSNISKLGKPKYGLDETQAKALISALTREIALIEGPPGTGKTVVGVQIMKVLLAKENRGTNIGPILTICFTNHALDQFLEHLLDENITNIVRLGSRSKSEKIKEFGLEEVCRNRSRNKKESYLIAKLHESLEEIEEEANNIKYALFRKWMRWSDIREYLMVEERKFYNKFNSISKKDLPSWVLGNNDGDKSWEKARKRKNRKQYIFEQWAMGEDITVINRRKELLLNPQKKNKKKDKGSNKNTFELLGEGTGDNGKNLNDDESQIDNGTIQWIKNYEEPKTNRPLNVLLKEYSIWKMSRVERQKLHDYWRTKIHDDFVEKLTDLQKRHEERRQEMNDIYDEGRRQVLLNSDVVGMTTNGAAKFQSLIRSIGPRIIVCEEAGEVLEAHILSALTPSTQHLILIGDHNQLRPHIATYSLSIDSTIGKNYQLDKSLFERLVYGDKAAKIEKAQLLTQRRMRKEISDLIRYTLYSDLVDGENTAKYPNVRGAQHNVYFIDHRHPEDGSGGDFAMKSHVNKYEVEMVVEMVKYFVRNGYTKPEDIAVLTPYLGQMIKIRDALAKSFVVVIDERDAQNLSLMEEGQEGEDNDDVKNVNVGNIGVASKKSLNQQVTLRTVDNFQGEEATIVIISLVRNFSGSGGHDSIGFLKSKNRSNVLLSRAREGMYLIGNSELMASKSKDMWDPVIDMLQKRDPPQVGFGMPIVCNQHPDYKNIIIDPKQFALLSPDGGCYEKCHIPLPCGHVCIYKCHSDNPEHIGIKCPQKCLRLHPECNHPCPKICFEDCEKCNFPIGDITLPGCGHVLQNAKCWQNRAKETLKCKTLVLRKLPRCEHSESIHCFESVHNVKCNEKCGKILECGHECLNECIKCQKLSTSQEESKVEEKTGTILPIERTQHGICKKVCDKLLFCGHTCKQVCHEGNECPPCRRDNKCTVSCEHTTCNKRCSEPCAVCAEKCLWECKHQGKCELSCGAPCYRLPCNEKCGKELECGHECAGVCGEICPSKDFCVICAPENVKNQVPDIIIDTTFSEVDWNEERMIVLSCGHVYTMETMDMLMEMKDYYEGSIEGGWTSIKILPTSPANTKACPACRAPIKGVRRYGRVIKKSTLDIQNKKFLLKYDNQLKEITKQIITLENGMNNKRNQLKNELSRIETRSGDVVLKEYNVTSNESPEITPYQYFENIEQYHGFDKIGEQVWITHVKKLLNRYHELTLIICATKIPPHKKAFEAAVSSLYQAKLAKENPEKDLIAELSNLHISEAASSNSTSSNSASMISLQSTFQETLSQIGISIPQVDRRIYLDAFFEIINIQKILLHETLFIIQEISKKSIFEDVSNEVWKKFAERIQRSIQNHLFTIREIAASTHYGRHLLLVSIEKLEFDLKMLAYQLRYPPNGSSVVDKVLQARIMGECKGIEESTVNITRNDGYINAEEEFKIGIHKRLENLLKNCKEIEVCAENSAKTLSIEEKLEIHRAMKTEFKRSGHWYECPNGHPYTIGECGRAMQMSRCPDCNAEIGGGSHQLTAGNRVNLQFGSL